MCWGQPSRCFDEDTVFLASTATPLLNTISDAIADDKTVIFLPTGDYVDHVNPTTSAAVTLVGEPGTSVTQTGNNETFHWRGTGTLTLIGLDISHGNSGAVVRAENGRVVVEDCVLRDAQFGLVDEGALSIVVRRSHIHGHENDGLALVDAYTVEGCLIEGNLGKGVTMTGAGEAFRLNTVAGNGNVGVDCSGSVPTLVGNIAWGNNSGGNQLASNCAAASSVYEGAPSTDGNLNLDPVFVDAPGRDYRLAAQSPLRDALSLSMPELVDVQVDIDHRARPLGGGYEPGCYELPVP